MNRYFSQIAKQSGLRFQDRLPGQHAAGEPMTRPAQLESEETIMVPSRLANEDTVPIRGLPRASSFAASRKITPAAQSSVHEDTPTVISTRADHAPTPSADPTDYGPPRKAGTSTRSAEQLKEPPVIEQRVLVEMGEINEPKPTDSKPDSGRAEMTMPGDAEALPSLAAESTGYVSKTAGVNDNAVAESGPLPAAAQESKKYFSKTAEIIERGEVESSEIETVLLREVQEWVAGSPAITDPTPPEGAEKSERVLVNEMREVRLMDEQTTREKTSQKKIETVEQFAGVAEQTYELSIGSISVVIEGEEKAAQPPRPESSRNQNSPGETTREVSRLSRNYL